MTEKSSSSFLAGGEHGVGGVGGVLGRLSLDGDELAQCVACGLCLPFCPTYRVTGEESASPRGRIAAMRDVQAGAPMEGPFADFMGRCVQCRACEVACPSGVPFGRLMEGARQALADETGSVPWWQRIGYRVLGHHRLLVAISRAGAMAQRCRLVPPRLASRLALPTLPWRQPPLVASGSDVWLFTGCVMDAWQRHVHQAAKGVIEASGAGVALPEAGGDCCGALHIHAGLGREARRLAERVMSSMPGDSPILVDSAGCGAALKDYGHLVGTDAAAQFAARVFDVQEWLATRMDRLPAGVWPSAGDGAAGAGAAGAGPVGAGAVVAGSHAVAIQDPCHLRQVQRRHEAVRTVLAPYVPIVELDDDGLCCGAGGAYSALHPELAEPIRQRKLEAIARSGCAVVASANPGCSMWLAAAGVEVRHPMEILAEAIGVSGGHRDR